MTRGSAPVFRWHGVLFLGGITALSAVSTDIILPATGVIARSLDQEGRQGGLLVGAFFIAFAIGQLFWGVFSDAFGRRLALLLSLGGFVLASLGCALADSFDMLLAARFLQGLMAGAPIIARAIVRDVASGVDAARLMTVLGAILTMATVVAPLLGAGLLVWFSWRAIFLAMALLGGLAALYALTLFQETAGARRPERFSLRYVAQSARYLLARPAFTGPVAILGLTFAGYAAIGAVGAVTAETRFGITPGQYGGLFALAAITNTSAALIARRLLKSLLPSRVNAIGIGFLALAGLVHLVLIFTSPTLALFWASVCLYVFAFGMVLPLSFALAMEPAGNMPGFAAALTGATYMLLGTLAVLLSTTLFDGSHRAISLTMAICAGLAVMIWAVGRMSRHADAPKN